MQHTLQTIFYGKAVRRALLFAAVIAPTLSGAQNNTRTPQHVYTNAATNVFGMPFASPDPLGQRIQLIYRPAELKVRTSNAKAPSGKISRIYLRTPSTASGNFTMANVFVKLGQTTDTSYVGDNVGESPFLTTTEVFRQASYQVSTPGWIEFTFAQPFQYDNTKSLVVEFGGTKGFRPVVNNYSKRMIFGGVGNAKGANIGFLYDLGFDFGTGSTTAVPGLEVSDISVFPNPATTSIHVQGAARGTMVLQDVSGRVVVNTAFARNNEISVRELPSGLYFYTLYNPQNEPLAAGKISIAH